MTERWPWRTLGILALAAIPAVVGAVLLVVRALDSEPTSAGETIASEAPPPIYTRMVCSLANEDARAARIQGFDGGDAVTVGDRTWWMFGDTLFVAESGKQIEQNTIGSSSELRPDGCPRIQYYAPGGNAEPFIEKDGSLTVWPVGAWPSGQDAITLYIAYIYGSGPYAYWVGEIGLGRLDLASMQVTVLERNLWNADSGFPDQVTGTQPVEIGDDGKLRVVLHTKDSQKYLARVDEGSMHEADAYEYWDGASWTAHPSRAMSLWDAPLADDDVAKLAAFENGASIAWNEGIGKYVAVANVGYDKVGARFADRLEGPWSEPQPWFDCLKFAEPYVPVCYSPFQHPELSRGPDSVMVAMTRFRIYDVAVFEAVLGTPMHAYGSGGLVRYEAPSDVIHGEDAGVAFYASDVPQEGFVPVYEWALDGRLRYGTRAPAEGAEQGPVVFYAPLSATVEGSFTEYRPVYRWTNGDEERLSPEHVSGYERGEIAFYAP